MEANTNMRQTIYVPVPTHDLARGHFRLLPLQRGHSTRIMRRSDAHPCRNHSFPDNPPELERLLAFRTRTSSRHCAADRRWPENTKTGRQWSRPEQLFLAALDNVGNFLVCSRNWLCGSLVLPHFHVEHGLPLTANLADRIVWDNSSTADR